MESLGTLFTTVLNQNTLGALILAGFFTLLGFMVKGMLANHGSISVAKIESETTLGTKAIETLTTALEVLQEENKSLKQSSRRMEDEIDRLIDFILRVVKATTKEEMQLATERLEQYIKHIGRWPY